MDWAGHILALAAGATIGGLFFVGLWWTTRRAVRSGRPHVWLLCSFLVRSAVAAAGFALLAMRGWQAAALGLLGFVIVRAAMTRVVRVAQTRIDRTRDRDRKDAPALGEATHGP